MELSVNFRIIIGLFSLCLVGKNDGTGHQGTVLTRSSHISKVQRQTREPARSILLGRHSRLQTYSNSVTSRNVSVPGTQARDVHLT